MSQFDAAPPNTHAGGNDDALRTKTDQPFNPPVDEQGEMYIDREAYQRDVPLWKRIWQHSLTQMILLSIQAFCGPAMADAIAGRSNPLFTSTCIRANGQVSEVEVSLPLKPRISLPLSITPCWRQSVCSVVH